MLYTVYLYLVLVALFRETTWEKLYSSLFYGGVNLVTYSKLIFLILIFYSLIFILTYFTVYLLVVISNFFKSTLSFIYIHAYDYIYSTILLLFSIFLSFYPHIILVYMFSLTLCIIFKSLKFFFIKLQVILSYLCLLFFF